MTTIALALTWGLSLALAAFGLLTVNGRRIIMATVVNVERHGGEGLSANELRDKYLILLEASTYPKMYLLFGQRARILAALDKLAERMTAAPPALPTGPSIWHANPYFRA